MCYLIINVDDIIRKIDLCSKTLTSLISNTKKHADFKRLFAKNDTP